MTTHAKAASWPSGNIFADPSPPAIIPPFLYLFASVFHPGNKLRIGVPRKPAFPSPINCSSEAVPVKRSGRRYWNKLSVILFQSMLLIVAVLCFAYLKKIAPALLKVPCPFIASDITGYLKFRAPIFSGMNWAATGTTEILCICLIALHGVVKILRSLQEPSEIPRENCSHLYPAASWEFDLLSVTLSLAGMSHCT